MIINLFYQNKIIFMILTALFPKIIIIILSLTIMVRSVLAAFMSIKNILNIYYIYIYIYIYIYVCVCVKCVCKYCSTKINSYINPTFLFELLHYT